MKPDQAPEKELSRFSVRRTLEEYPKDSAQKMAVLFTDIVGSTSYFRAHGDLAGREMLQRHQDIATKAIAEHSGVLVKTLGDSVMAYFLDPKEAVRAAVKIQQELVSHNEKREAEDQIHIRIAVHYGEGIIEEHDIFGNVVNLAAKILPLVDGEQICISQPLHDLVHDLIPLRFERVEFPKEKGPPGGLPLYRILWDKKIKFEPSTVLLLYLKPIASLNRYHFPKVWTDLLANGDRFWKGKIMKESVLDDKSVVLILRDAVSAIEVARHVMAFLRKRLGDEYGSLPLPLQVVIDSGPYLRADKIFAESLKVHWDEIDLGEIYISFSAHHLLEDKQALPTNPIFDKDHPQIFYKIRAAEDTHSSRSLLFFYQNALMQGHYPPCFYCGARSHLSLDCPSKKIGGMTQAIKRLGHLSLTRINRLFFRHITDAGPEDLEGAGGDRNETGDSHLAESAFYELKWILQLRFFEMIWDSHEEDWDKAKNTRSKNPKGGPVWLAHDCIRVSSLARAETLLTKALEENPHDYKVYCALGYLNMERNDFRQARHFFGKALDHARTKPKKMLFHFLLSRLYELKGESKLADQHLNEIFSLHPACQEAMYQRLVLQFRNGLEEQALKGLIKFVHGQGEYFIAALIDPELAAFSGIIHPELETLFQDARAEAGKMVSKAREELERLEAFIGKEEERVKEANSLLEKIGELSKSDSYLGYRDMIRYGDVIISMSRRTVEERKGKLYDFLYELDDRCENHLAFVKNYPYRNFAATVLKQLLALRKRVHGVKDAVKSPARDHFKKYLAEAEEIAGQLKDVDSKVKKLEGIKELHHFLRAFLKKTLFLQCLNLLIGIVFLPMTLHYLMFIVPELKMSSQSLWPYQKTTLFLGGIAGLWLALMMTLKPSSRK